MIACLKKMHAQIIKNKILSPGYYRLTLNCPTLARVVKPGQFVMIRVSNTYDPLLRRPFCIHYRDVNLVQILYQVVGKGTKLMTEMLPGQMLDVLGPLGNGFRLYPDTRQALLVGGGVGIAPLLFLAQELVQQKIESVLFLGGKTKDDLLAVDAFRQLNIRLFLATEDGSCGKTALVTNILAEYLAQTSDTQNRAIFACGPMAMLAHIANSAQSHKLPCQVSLDVAMACGVGACGGCVVKTRGTGNEGFHYSRVCQEGPVFEATKILWESV
jgi:dihydroorotate dehydrogenase electron transfer subunit